MSLKRKEISYTYKWSTLPKYSHRSYHEIKKLIPRKNEKNISKPVGLYYSYGIDWIESENGFNEIKNEIKISINKKKDILIIRGIPLEYQNSFGIYSVNIPNKLKIKLSQKSDSTKILMLKTVQDLIQFSQMFKIRESKSRSLKKKERTEKYTFINWDQVSKLYGGLEFPNYWNTKKKLDEQFDLRKVLENFDWFLLFDNQGGVIWNTDIIKIQKYLPLKIEKK